MTPIPSSLGNESSAPAPLARILAVLAIVIAGLCGGFTGYAVTDLQCLNDCSTIAGIVGVASALVAAGGVAIVAVLTLRAMSEWHAIEAQRADADS